MEDLLDEDFLRNSQTAMQEQAEQANLLGRLCDKLASQNSLVESLSEERQVLTSCLMEIRQEVSALVSENERLAEHMSGVQKAYDNLLQMAQGQGLGKQVRKLCADSGLGDYLNKKVYARLYDDAFQRQRRRLERAQKAFEEAQALQAKIQQSQRMEFL